MDKADAAGREGKEMETKGSEGAIRKDPRGGTDKKNGATGNKRRDGVKDTLRGISGGGRKSYTTGGTGQ